MGRVAWLIEDAVDTDAEEAAELLGEEESDMFAEDAALDAFDSERRFMTSRLAITRLLKWTTGGGPTLSRN
jgi:hypothetical protein